MEGESLPSSTRRPAEADDEIAADAVVPVHGERASALAVGELTQVAVVVLDIVDAARVTGDKTSFRLGHGGGEHGRNKARKSCGELHVGLVKGSVQILPEEL